MRRAPDDRQSWRPCSGRCVLIFDDNTCASMAFTRLLTKSLPLSSFTHHTSSTGVQEVCIYCLFTVYNNDGLKSEKD